VVAWAAAGPDDDDHDELLAAQDAAGEDADHMTRHPHDPPRPSDHILDLLRRRDAPVHDLVRRRDGDDGRRADDRRQATSSM
jgi:hypothetical protein